VLPRAHHERILTAYGCAFYRSVLLGHATDQYSPAIGNPPVCHISVYLSFMKQGQTTVDHHEDGNGIGRTPQPDRAVWRLNADEFLFAQALGRGGSGRV
jgi:hypothetical protein